MAFTLYAARHLLPDHPRLELHQECGGAHHLAQDTVSAETMWACFARLADPCDQGPFFPGGEEESTGEADSPGLSGFLSRSWLHEVSAVETGGHSVGAGEGSACSCAG